MKIIVFILSIIAVPLIQLGIFLATRGGKLLTAATTFVALIGGLLYYVSSYSQEIVDFISGVSSYATAFGNYIDKTSSIARAFMYYLAADHLYYSFSSTVFTILGVLLIIVVVSAALVLSAVIPIILAHIGAYAAKGVQDSFKKS